MALYSLIKLTHWLTFLVKHTQPAHIARMGEKSQEANARERKKQKYECQSVESELNIPVEIDTTHSNDDEAEDDESTFWVSIATLLFYTFYVLNLV